MERKGQKIRVGSLPNRDFLILQRFPPSRNPAVIKAEETLNFRLISNPSL
jgi:hypothetical protein